MINELRSFYMLFAMWMSSFVWCLMKSFAQFFIEWSVFFLQSCRSFFIWTHIWSMSPSVDICMADISSHSLSLAFRLLMGSFDNQKLSLMQYSCSLVSVPLVYSRNLCFSKVMKIFFSLFSFKCFIVLSFMFGFIMT